LWYDRPAHDPSDDDAPVVARLRWQWVARSRALAVWFIQDDNLTENVSEIREAVELWLAQRRAVLRRRRRMRDHDATTGQE
jgi:hypothetical protein